MTDSTDANIGQDRSERADAILRGVAIVLASLVLGGVALFGYTVWKGRSVEQTSTPAQRALVELGDFVKKNPNSAAARVRYGEALATAGLPEQATEQLEAAVKLDENHTGAWLDLGMIAMSLDERAKAEQYFQKVIDLTAGQEFEAVNQRREKALFHLGEIALDDRRFEDAAGFFKAAIRIRRDASDSYYLLGQSLRGMGDDAAAVKQLENAILFDPNYAEARFLLGEIMLEQGDRINAAVHLVKAAEVAPQAQQVKEALGSLGTVDEAIARAKRFLADKQYQQAVEEALLARALGPSNANAELVYAEALLAKGNRRAAKKAAAKAVELDPNNAEAKQLLDSLGS